MHAHPLLQELEGELGVTFDFGEISDVSTDVKAVFDSLNTDKLVVPKEVMPIEELALMSKLQRVLDMEELALLNGLISPEKAKAGWRKDERIYVASALGRIQVGYFEEALVFYFV